MRNLKWEGLTSLCLFLLILNSSKSTDFGLQRPAYSIFLQYTSIKLEKPHCSDKLPICPYAAKLPVGSQSNSEFPTFEIPFSIDLFSSTTVIFDKDLKKINCGSKENQTDSGCYLMSSNKQRCSALGAVNDCQNGYIDMLLFNHSYSYTPSAKSDGFYNDSNKGRIPGLVQTTSWTFMKPLDVTEDQQGPNILGLSPSSTFDDFIKSVYTLRRGEFSFSITKNMELDIMPNLLGYIVLYEQTVGEAWQLKRFGLYQNYTLPGEDAKKKSSHKIRTLEKGRVPVCISLIGTDLFYIKDRDNYIKSIMQDICSEDECPYNQENIKSLGRFILNFTNTEEKIDFQLGISPKEFAFKKKGRKLGELKKQPNQVEAVSDSEQDYIGLRIGEIGDLRRMGQCDENTRVAISTPFLSYFKFVFTFTKKRNFLRLHEKVDGLSIEEKFYLLNFGGALLALFMLATSIKIAYKYY